VEKSYAIILKMIRFQKTFHIFAKLCYTVINQGVIVKMKKIEILVETFSDPSVGIFGGTVPFNIELPQDSWDNFDEEDQKEMIKEIKALAINMIDPDGSAITAEELEAENKMWEEIYKEEAESQERSFREE
jgi:hypothetical protein